MRPPSKDPSKTDPNWLMKFVAIGAADGIAFGWLVLLTFSWMDVMGIGTLLHESRSGLLAMVIMLIQFGITFGMVGIGYRVMVVLPTLKDD